MKKKNIVIIGSTGSIGKSALSIINSRLVDFNILALTANENSEGLLKQVKQFKPKYAALTDFKKAEQLGKKLKKTKVLSGIEGISKLAALKEADVILLSIVGATGIIPLLSAIRAGKTIALANKEALIIAGDIIKKEVKKYKATIFPVDSEHNAIFQALQGNKKTQVKRLIITASGGPFKNTPISKMKNITPARALKHPTWKMGKKITIDSSTLMNKGLEVIEAHYLFDMPYSKIDVIIHPQSIVHSMVEYKDGSVIAQLSSPDMRLPIMYALTFPDRRRAVIKPLKLDRLKQLDFAPVDFKKFKCFSLALKAGKAGGTMPACMNAANEYAVKSFLGGKINFNKIPLYIEKAMNFHKNKKNPSLEDILRADLEARQYLERLIND